MIDRPCSVGATGESELPRSVTVRRTRAEVQDSTEVPSQTPSQERLVPLGQWDQARVKVKVWEEQGLTQKPPW
jgi:hypothetical protein